MLEFCLIIIFFLILVWLALSAGFCADFYERCIANDKSPKSKARSQLLFPFVALCSPFMIVILFIEKFINLIKTAIYGEDK